MPNPPFQKSRTQSICGSRDGDVVDAEALIGYCAERMPRHMVPKTVESLDSLPKTGSGKIDYPALRRREGLS